MYIQNPALDITEEDPNEISGEFGDPILPSPKVSNATTPPLPPSEQQAVANYAKAFQLSHMNALIWKNFVWMYRNLMIMAAIFVVPVLQVCLFCFAIGHDPRGLKLAISDHELHKHNFTDCPIVDTGCCSLVLAVDQVVHMPFMSIPVHKESEYVNSIPLCFLFWVSTFIYTVNDLQRDLPKHSIMN